MSIYVAYYRVSTAKQGASGLGLEAQQAAVRQFVSRDTDSGLMEEFTEVESGRCSDRPQLKLALARCKALGAKLVIAKLDRLARNVKFIADLMEDKVDFVALDMPNSTPFMLHIFAAVAEEEARRISTRIKEALAARRARGLPVGNTKEQALRVRAAAYAFVREHAPLIEETAAMTLQKAAAVWNDRGPAPRRGGQRWTPCAIARLRKYLAATKVADEAAKGVNDERADA